MPTILNPAVPVTVEYYSAKGRATKRFEAGFLARRFYVAKSKQGKRPAVKGERATVKSYRPAKLVACYVRVSTVGQNEAGQRAEIERWLTGNGIDSANVRWFLDKKTGENLKRCRPHFSLATWERSSSTS